MLFIINANKRIDKLIEKKKKKMTGQAPLVLPNVLRSSVDVNVLPSLPFTATERKCQDIPPYVVERTTYGSWHLRRADSTLTSTDTIQKFKFPVFT